MSGATVTFHAHGMHCHGCEHVIEAGLRKLAGVSHVEACYPTETVRVDYDAERTDFRAIRDTVETNGYRVEIEARSRSVIERLALTGATLVALTALILIDHRWISGAGALDLSQNLSLWLIFILGLVTGFHCIGMCGAFVVSYATAAADAGRPAVGAHLSFAIGKTMSYTLIGALFGAAGAVIAFTPLLRGAAGVVAGLFLIVFGLNTLGLFKSLRRFRLGLPASLERWVHHEAGVSNQPFVIGLLNGLMIACGPLQAMYVMAAGTGSAVEGAKMLFAFGLGTLPVMLAFGAVASMLSSALTHRLLRASGLIVVALGAVMINRGLILTGWGVDLDAIVSRFERVEAPPSIAGPTQTIVMEANGLGYEPSRFTLTKGVGVEWIIDATEVTECNKRIVVPVLGLEFALKPGRQTVRFTPTQSGVIPWSCWMGMMRGQFDVVEPGAAPAPTVAPPSVDCMRCRKNSPEAASQTYIVQKGDTLARIARKLYGDPARWREIAAANPGQDAKKLSPGSRLILPAPRP